MLLSGNPADCSDPFEDVGGACVRAEDASPDTWRQAVLQCNEADGTLLVLQAADTLEGLRSLLKKQDDGGKAPTMECLKKTDT